MVQRQKVIHSSFKMFLNWCKYYNVTVIRFFYDYGYNTMYANALSHKDGLNVRIETKAAKNKFCAEFAIKCKSNGYTVHFPMCYSECDDNAVETVAHYLNGNKVNTAIINNWLKKYNVK